MDVTFITDDGSKELVQGVERFHRMDSESTDLPENHTQPWAVITFEKELEILPWEWDVDGGSVEGTL